MQINIINVTAVIDYIESNLAEKLDLEIVAHAVHFQNIICTVFLRIQSA